MAYDINYDDERFTQVESDKQQALTEVEQTYGGMIENSDQYYQAQIDASKQWADKQSQLQQENTDFTIEQIEQQIALAAAAKPRNDFHKSVVPVLDKFVEIRLTLDFHRPPSRFKKN